MLLLAHIALPSIFSFPPDPPLLILEKVAEIALGFTFLVIGYFILFKSVPDGHIGLIWGRRHRTCHAFPGQNRVYVWPWEHFELYDLREKQLDLSFDCVTRDHIKVTLSVNLRWQVDAHQLETYLNMGIDGSKMLERFIGMCLMHDVITRTLDVLQDDLRILTFHLVRLLTWHPFSPYSVDQFGIIVREPRISALTLPAGITALAEQAKAHQLERAVALHRRLIAYADRVADAQSRAQQLFTLCQVIGDTHTTVEFTEVLELIRSWAPTGGSPQDGTG
jgi:regulator of protease activity HflC (stomatin/prohibitin superfamily)